MLTQTTGKIATLRVNQVGDRFGPAADNIQAEVVLRFANRPDDEAFGFGLRDDANAPVRKAMLDLMRDAFTHGWDVKIDYEHEEGKKKGIVTRVTVSKDPGVPSGPRSDRPVLTL